MSVFHASQARYREASRLRGANGLKYNARHEKTRNGRGLTSSTGFLLNQGSDHVPCSGFLSSPVSTPCDPVLKVGVYLVRNQRRCHPGRSRLRGESVLWGPIRWMDRRFDPWMTFWLISRPDFTMATQVSKKRKFVADGVFRAELNEFFTRELAEEQYSGCDVRVTHARTEVDPFACICHSSC